MGFLNSDWKSSYQNDKIFYIHCHHNSYFLSKCVDHCNNFSFIFFMLRLGLFICDAFMGLFKTGLQRLYGIARAYVIPCALVGMKSGVVTLKSKAFTFTSFFLHFFHATLSKRISSTLATRAPFRDFRLRAALGSGNLWRHMTFVVVWLLW